MNWQIALFPATVLVCNWIGRRLWGRILVATLALLFTVFGGGWWPWRVAMPFALIFFWKDRVETEKRRVGTIGTPALRKAGDRFERSIKRQRGNRVWIGVKSSESATGTVDMSVMVSAKTRVDLHRIAHALDPSYDWYEEISWGRVKPIDPNGTRFETTP